MKKLLSLLLALILVLLTACGTTPAVDNTEAPDNNEIVTSDNTSAPADNENDVVENIVVGISVGEEGYYCIMADVKPGYYEGELVEIAITDPALLSFQVSENFDYGVYIFSLTEGDAMLESLAAVMQELQSTGQNELAARIRLILDEFSNAGPIISAST